MKKILTICKDVIKEIILAPVSIVLAALSLLFFVATLPFALYLRVQRAREERRAA